MKLARENGRKVVLLSVILAFVLVVCLVMLFVVNTSIISRNSGNNSFFAKVSIFDESSSKSRTTIIPITSPFKEFMSVSKRYSNGEVVTLSPLSSKKYECTGACYCANSEETIKTMDSIETSNRRIVSALSKPISLFTFAISTTVALNLAQRYFQSECVAQFSSICKEEDIYEEVVQCSHEENIFESDQEYDGINEARTFNSRQGLKRKTRAEEKSSHSPPEWLRVAQEYQSTRDSPGNNKGYMCGGMCFDRTFVECQDLGTVEEAEVKAGARLRFTAECAKRVRDFNPAKLPKEVLIECMCIKVPWGENRGIQRADRCSTVGGKYD